MCELVPLYVKNSTLPPLSQKYSKISVTGGLRRPTSSRRTLTMTLILNRTLTFEP
jgi:hypothetical protein